MTKTFSILSLILLQLSVSYAQENVILEGDDDYPPYSYVEKGEFKGIYVELLSKAAKLLEPEYIVTLTPIPWKRGLANLKNGVSFALFPPGFKKERTFIDTYSESLYTERVVIFCNSKIMKMNPKKFPDDFEGLTIGINAGFLLSARLISAAKSKKVTLEEGKGNESNIRKLFLNRIPCYASDRGAAVYSAKKLQLEPKLKNFYLIEATELSSENTFIGYSFKNNPKYKADFIRKMNAAINTLKHNGAASKIEKSYLN